MAVFKRGNRWAVKVYYPATRGQRWVGTFPTRRDAQAAEADARSAQPSSRTTAD